MASGAKAPFKSGHSIDPAVTTTMSTTPWLSILVASGSPSHLGGCLASICAQAGAGVELILCAGSDRAAQRHSQWDGRITQLQQPDSDLSARYNAMLDIARGHFVWLLSSSDRLSAGAISELRSIVGLEDPDLVLCDSMVLTPWISPQYRRRSELRPTGFSCPAAITLADRSDLLCRLLGPEQLQPHSIISRRSLWGSLRFPEQHHHCERATLPRLALRAWTYHYTAACWVTHHMSAPGDVIDAQDGADLSAALFEFTREFRQFRHASREARFLLGHACARNFIQAAVQAGDCSSAVQAQRLALYRRNFRRCTPLSPGDLLRRYLERGWREHWLNLSHWLNASCEAAKQQCGECAPSARQESEISALR